MIAMLRQVWRRTALLLALVPTVAVTAVALVPHAGLGADLPGSVAHFPSDDAALTGGAPTPLEARLLTPAAPPPWPAIVALHGCSGLYRNHGATVYSRDRDWSERLRDEGYLVLLVDSFTPRGFDTVCKLKERPVRQEAERKADAAAALAYLRSRPDVQTERIGLLGWSHGGGTVLAAQGNPPQAGYRAAVSFYPGCNRALKTPGWLPKAPLLMLVGEADDWTPVGPCRVLAARPELAGVLELVTYPQATHDFDAPGRLTPRTMTGIPNVKSGTVHMVTDPAARDDAIRRVDAFFARWLKDAR